MADASKIEDAVATDTKPRSECYGTIWVCIGCLMMEANGENIGDGGDGIAPLSEIEPPYTVTLGMGWEDHASDCLIFLDRNRGNVANIKGGYECECETNSFSWSACDGCGSRLGGERHAMTLWKEG